MEYQVACPCGKALDVSEDMAGSAAACSCGRTVRVPSLSELRGEAITAPVPPPVPNPQPPDEPPRPDAAAAIIAPTPVALWAEGGARPGRPRPVMAALTAEALWVQDTWQLRRVPLHSLGSIKAQGGGKELVLTLRPELSAEMLRVTFATSGEGQRWHRELQARQQ